MQLDSDDMQGEEERVLSVMASAAIPGVFPPVKLRDWTLVDGGVSWNMNMIGAIQKCRDQVGSDA